MKVVVGKAYHHQTPVFASEMTSVGFRPYWDVPLSIQRAELVPKIAHDRSYLAENNFEVVNAKREVVSTGDVDDALLARLRALQLYIRQVPGPKNSLGLIKFVFPNQYDVYMHDTPVTELFAQTRRDFSHGCIRLEKPEQLAAWVLRDKPEWTPERINDAAHGEKTFEVRLSRPIPVLIVYATAVALANGEVRFLEDIYGLDAQLEQLLAKGYPYSPSQHSPSQHSPSQHSPE
jgi:murein L,D-transpeptidase YcbB/YkuD